MILSYHLPCFPPAPPSGTLDVYRTIMAGWLQLVLPPSMTA